MSKPLIIGFVVCMLLVLGWVCQQAGITTTILTTPSVPVEPQDSSWWDKFLGAIKYLFDIIASLLQIMGFQAQLPPPVNIIFGAVVDFVVLVIFAELVS